MATAKKTTKKARAARQAAGAKASIKLDAAFYPRRALQAAAQAFSDLAQIELQKRDNWYLVRFAAMRPAVAGKVPDEFANYVLALVVSEK